MFVNMNMNMFGIFKRMKYTTRHMERFYSIKSQDAHKFANEMWDVIISGGGMVGCALACSLGSSPVLSQKKILVLETSQNTDYSIDPNKYSNRVCALNKNTRSLFDSFKAWDKILNLRLKEVKKIVVWESCSNARIAFNHGGMTESIAYIVENDVILKVLYETIKELEGKVNVLMGTKAINYTFPSDKSDHISIHLEGDVTLKTKMLVGADGINSLVRKRMNIKYIAWNYNQKGIVATLKLSEPTSNVVAWQRFLPTGPIALLPLTDDLCSLVWTVSLPMSEELLKLPEEQFVDALNLALWDESQKTSIVESATSTVKKFMSAISPGLESVHQLPPSILSVEANSRAAFPLGLGHATEYVASRVALIGDSAHRVHPLAGQGVNLGFGDVKCLTERLETSVYNGNDIGSIESLLDYEAERQRHVLPTMFTIDALNRLYKTEFTPIVLMRSLGLTLLDALHPFKDKMLSQASA